MRHVLPFLFAAGCSGAVTLPCELAAHTWAMLAHHEARECGIVTEYISGDSFSRRWSEESYDAYACATDALDTGQDMLVRRRVHRSEPALYCELHRVQLHGRVLELWERNGSVGPRPVGTLLGASRMVSNSRWQNADGGTMTTLAVLWGTGCVVWGLEPAADPDAIEGESFETDLVEINYAVTEGCDAHVCQRALVFHPMAVALEERTEQGEFVNGWAATLTQRARNRLGRAELALEQAGLEGIWPCGDHPDGISVVMTLSRRDESSPGVEWEPFCPQPEELVDLERLYYAIRDELRLCRPERLTADCSWFVPTEED